MESATREFPGFSRLGIHRKVYSVLDNLAIAACAL
jgi:hypothetical protein